MSLFSYPFGREAPINAVIATTAATTVYVAGKNGASIIGLRLTEGANTSSQSATVTVVNGATSTSSPVYQRAFSAKEVYDPVTLDGVPLVLLGDGYVTVTLGGATSVHVTGVAVEPALRG